MIDWPTLLAAFSIGILGGAHCIGMCGGIIGALTLSAQVDQYRQRMLLIASYNIGRIASYVFIAWIFYQFFHAIEQYFSLRFMRYVAGVLLVAMGLYLADWWRGLLYLEKAGSYVWRWIQPFSKKLLPVKTYSQALLLGVLWGWLPCGLIYSVLAYSSAADSALNAMLTMFAFALGTLPAVMASGLLAERLVALVKQSVVRKMFALLIIVFGVWTLWQTSHHAGHHHGNHDSHSEHNQHEQHHDHSLHHAVEAEIEDSSQPMEGMHMEEHIKDQPLDEQLDQSAPANHHESHHHHHH